MKKLFYFILLVAGLSSIHSCKDLVDEEGNPLLDLNDNTGLIGPRSLFREITNSDTIAEYRYNGLLLSKALTKGKRTKSVTDLMWSGDKISKITFYGFLDEDKNGTLDNDSVAYTQLLTYGAGGRLTIIAENRISYVKTVPPGSTIPVLPWVVSKKYKKLYNLEYATGTDKLSKITMKNGEEITGVNFDYTTYSVSNYTYTGDNISKVERNYGPMTGGTMGTATEKYKYEYFTFDSQINPHTLLPFAYKVSSLLATRVNDEKSQSLSINNPRRLTVTDMMVPIPTPIVFTTNYAYDLQTYMTRGFGINYIYKPQ
ncbi:hypothetical protein SAMN05421796_101465 [Chryseobacterium piscicola]|uniref:DUF4595 domain-containing protein n=1 Tax=Chryseobacterium piscicola TaxID=551459 RepID=A0A1N7KD33_9FLAO|nr:hypothetical protein [Chryseobacterium piscicola]PQA96371.1 hypothetical protein B0A70_04440 [Chryseobacterium piscicola]SIS59462.1 hypothetical protein SAMN05421796_101465 [Chryseobacterium piscicola]